MFEVGQKVRVASCAAGDLASYKRQIVVVTKIPAAGDIWFRVKSADGREVCAYARELEEIPENELPPPIPAGTGPRNRCRDCVYYHESSSHGECGFQRQTNWSPVNGNSSAIVWRRTCEHNAHGRCRDFSPNLRFRLWSRIVEIATPGIRVEV